VRSGGSYASHSDLRVHVGLGQAARADAVEVAWPGGRRERFGPFDADRFVTLEEGSGAAVLRSEAKSPGDGGVR
jgi:hypothetical protein